MMRERRRNAQGNGRRRVQKVRNCKVRQNQRKEILTPIRTSLTYQTLERAANNYQCKEMSGEEEGRIERMQVER